MAAANDYYADLIVGSNILISQKALDRRLKTESLSDESVESYVNELIDEIKSAGDWLVISMTEFVKTHELRTVSDRYVIIERLQSHPNIISRPKPNHKGEEYDKNEELPHTVPIEYKWVSEQEKKDLGFNGVVNRKIVGDKAELIEEKFSEVQNPANILSVTEYLYDQGCFNGWGLLEPIKAAAKTGIPIKTLLDILELMQKKHCLVIGNYRETTDKQTQIRDMHVGRIANTEEEYQEFCKYAKENDNIAPIDRDIKRRNRKKKATEIPENETKPTSNITKPEEVSVSGDFDSLNQEIASFIADKYNEYIKSTIKTKTLEYENILEKNNEVGRKLISEKEDIQSKLDKYINENAELKRQVEGLVEYHNKYEQNITNVLNELMGKTMMWIADFTQFKTYQLNDDKIINSKRSELIKYVMDVMDQVTEYKPDTGVPNLYK